MDMSCLFICLHILSPKLFTTFGLNFLREGGIYIKRCWEVNFDLHEQNLIHDKYFPCRSEQLKIIYDYAV
jgi:hypothetical protein